MKIPPVPYTTPLASWKRRVEWRNADWTSLPAWRKIITPFLHDEFSCALTRGKDSAPGPDQIHNQMFKTPAGRGTYLLLRIFNKIWMEHTFPRTWREAIIIPIPKDGKDRTKPSTLPSQSRSQAVYANFWSEWWIRVWSGTWSRETYLPPIQCGFRKNRSTMDHLVTLTTQISTAFVLRQHLVAISLI